MAQKQSNIINTPTFTCVECGVPAPPQERWANNNEGEIFLTEVDAWCTYYLDIARLRMEFCGAQCCTYWLKKRSSSDLPHT
jgi:hypothetical protein